MKGHHHVFANAAIDPVDGGDRPERRTDGHERRVSRMANRRDRTSGERRSLLPLLLNPIPRLDVVLGKWLAVSFFSIAGLALNLLGFAVVIANSGLHRSADTTRVLLTIALGIFPLSLFAAALQLLSATEPSAFVTCTSYAASARCRTNSTRLGRYFSMAWAKS